MKPLAFFTTYFFLLFTWVSNPIVFAGEGEAPPGMKLIPSGEFMMGSEKNEGYKECKKYYKVCRKDWYIDENPQHMVNIDSFFLDKYEVSQGEYQKVMGNNPSQFIGKNLPVESVTWEDANKYCRKIGKRLPTEAEWEKAAKGGKGFKFSWGMEFESLKGNFCDTNCKNNWKLNQFDDENKNTSPIGSFPPNAYGLYDMSGNVWEWVSDWYDVNYYKNASRNNPKGPRKGTEKILRGGSWLGEPSTLRTSFRFRLLPENKNFHIGFRCAK